MKAMVTVLCTAALCSACGGSDNGPAANGEDAATTTGSSGESDAPGAYQDDYETSGAFFTRMSEPADSGSVHGTVRIWYSKSVMDMPLDGPFMAPEGTVAIKDEFDSSGAVFVKVVMVKREAGYDSEHHDWYYEARNADGTLASDPVPGTPSLCVDCHQDAEDTDYLQGFSISN